MPPIHHLSGNEMTAKNPRDHIIEVGLDLVHSAGYTATGVKEILKRAGIAALRMH
jgi:AcrR family transcriptional regulator